MDIYIKSSEVSEQYLNSGVIYFESLEKASTNISGLETTLTSVASGTKLAFNLTGTNVDFSSKKDKWVTIASLDNPVNIVQYNNPNSPFLGQTTFTFSYHDQPLIPGRSYTWDDIEIPSNIVSPEGVYLIHNDSDSGFSSLVDNRESFISQSNNRLLWEPLQWAYYSTSSNVTVKAFKERFRFLLKSTYTSTSEPELSLIHI